MGPRHALRPAIGWPRRVHPDVAAAPREVALRLEARARLARGEALRGADAAAGLDMMGRTRMALASPSVHRRRLFTAARLGLVLIVASLAIGMAGYMALE